MADQLPPLPPGTPGRPAKENHRDRYGVILVCPDEVTQQTVYEALVSLKLMKIKVVVA